MNKSNSSKILEKIQILERDLQKLKIEAYFGLPSKKQKSIYPEKSLWRALRQTRKSIWKGRYAKKI